ncbi:Pectinesterase domain-containing protein [Rhizoctonia solani AG-1 IA]|uniref:Pectinesterase domain-containing protein n=1 Tax=Thanatephorus cucumeris (strain AG1-IA) TaxID=983506 RepID=L8WP34_THACA|nr:Pectinesterase domain-containing protein [Rhizoctonia solani AG-1 IA]
MPASFSKTPFLARKCGSSKPKVVTESNPCSSQPAGWSAWGTTNPMTDHVFYGEYNNSGPGSWNSKRAPFATNMTEALTLDTVFGGSTNWVDPAYL